MYVNPLGIKIWVQIPGVSQSEFPKGACLKDISGKEYLLIFLLFPLAFFTILTNKTENGYVWDTATSFQIMEHTQKAAANTSILNPQFV